MALVAEVENWVGDSALLLPVGAAEGEAVANGSRNGHLALKQRPRQAFSMDFEPPSDEEADVPYGPFLPGLLDCRVVASQRPIRQHEEVVEVSIVASPPREKAAAAARNVKPKQARQQQTAASGDGSHDAAALLVQGLPSPLDEGRHPPQRSRRWQQPQEQAAARLFGTIRIVLQLQRLQEDEQHHATPDDDDAYYSCYDEGRRLLPVQASSVIKCSFVVC
ncbi:hypothetical protein BAE44_0024084 [Dichanthelium oligosanthes]|uniref:Uncharacterized protein n=1 Tax=Dichanthelium oligosanthes TaxID=888268 RepID=A0A1E5UPV5_9POAL|nr:hypothetical protein BAE44_0024084 [Dichanthelium oligosanthes]